MREQINVTDGVTATLTTITTLLTTINLPDRTKKWFVAAWMATTVITTDLATTETTSYALAIMFTLDLAATAAATEVMEATTIYAHEKAGTVFRENSDLIISTSRVELAMTKPLVLPNLSPIFNDPKLFGCIDGDVDEAVRNMEAATMTVNALLREKYGWENAIILKKPNAATVEAIKKSQERSDTSLSDGDRLAKSDDQTTMTKLQQCSRVDTRCAFVPVTRSTRIAMKNLAQTTTVAYLPCFSSQDNMLDQCGKLHSRSICCSLNPSKSNCPPSESLDEARAQVRTWLARNPRGTADFKYSATRQPESVTLNRFDAWCFAIFRVVDDLGNQKEYESPILEDQGRIWESLYFVDSAESLLEGADSLTPVLNTLLQANTNLPSFGSMKKRKSKRRFEVSQLQPEKAELVVSRDRLKLADDIVREKSPGKITPNAGGASCKGCVAPVTASKTAQIKKVLAAKHAQGAWSLAKIGMSFMSGGGRRKSRRKGRRRRDMAYQYAQLVAQQGGSSTYTRYFGMKSDERLEKYLKSECKITLGDLVKRTATLVQEDFPFNVGSHTPVEEQAIIRMQVAGEMLLEECASRRSSSVTPTTVTATATPTTSRATSPMVETTAVPAARRPRRSSAETNTTSTSTSRGTSTSTRPVSSTTTSTTRTTTSSTRAPDNPSSRPVVEEAEEGDLMQWQLRSSDGATHELREVLKSTSSVDVDIGKELLFEGASEQNLALLFLPNAPVLELATGSSLFINEVCNNQLDTDTLTLKMLNELHRVEQILLTVTTQCVEGKPFPKALLPDPTLLMRICAASTTNSICDDQKRVRELFHCQIDSISVNTVTKIHLVVSYTVPMTEEVLIFDTFTVPIFRDKEPDGGAFEILSLELPAHVGITENDLYAFSSDECYQSETVTVCPSGVLRAEEFHNNRCVEMLFLTQEGEEPTCEVTNSVTDLDCIARVYDDFTVVSYRSIDDIELDQKYALCGRQRNKPGSCVVPHSFNSAMKQIRCTNMVTLPQASSLVKIEPVENQVDLQTLQKFSLEDQIRDLTKTSQDDMDLAMEISLLVTLSWMLLQLIAYVIYHVRTVVTLMRQPRVRWTPRFRRRPRTDTELVKLLKDYEPKKIAATGRVSAY